MLLLAAVAMQTAGDIPAVEFSGRDKIVIRAGSTVLMRATVKGTKPTWQVEEQPAEPLYLGYPHGPKTAEFVPAGRTRKTLVITLPQGVEGTTIASADSFACTDRTDVPLGSTYGRPDDALYNGVYDRAGDWLLTVEGGNISVRPLGRGRYGLTASGGPCILRLKTNYYRDHLGYFLWDKAKPLWTKPVAGWCSWMAHQQEVTQSDVLTAARFFSANLKDYGYDIIQIDDGYQRVLQFMKPEDRISEPIADYWNKPNDKFPDGMQTLASKISALGMTPGIWIGDYLPLGIKHSEGYVTDPDGKPHRGPWVNYAVNALIPDALDEAYLQSVRGLRQKGWRYFKIDTLRHVIYDNYRKAPEYWKARGESPEQAFRALLAATKKEIGPDVYMLACWGTIPEMAGLPDGCRIGEDVQPDFPSMRRAAKYIAQFQHLNNVVWRNDPDYMCLRVPVPQAQAWATMSFLAGGHVMVSDPVAAYDEARVDILRRVGPPLFARPLNVVPQKPDPEWMTLSAEKDGHRWLVASRFAWKPEAARAVPLQSLGLDPKRQYLAFDFWSSTFLGAVSGQAEFHALDPGSCQVIAFHPLEDHPQVLGTDRHLSQGAYELENVRWSGSELSGRLKRGAGRAWSLFVHVPTGWRLQAASPGTATVAQNGAVIKLTLPLGNGPVGWNLAFSR